MYLFGFIIVESRTFIMQIGLMPKAKECLQLSWKMTRVLTKMNSGTRTKQKIWKARVASRIKTKGAHTAKAATISYCAAVTVRKVKKNNGNGLGGD